MSRYPWRNTSEDIAGQVESQWETPLGAQAKADKAEENAKAYSDEKLNAHIGTGGAAHANAVPNGLAGFMTGLDKAKLDGIEERANHYVHPATHPPSIIAQDANNRFVSDAEKATWNAKASTDEATATTKGLMSASDKAKLDESTASATPGTLVQRDASGRLKAATPSAKTDVARKSEVDTVQDDLDAHKADADMHVTKADHDKLDAIQAGAEVNQNAFSAVKVTGQGDVAAKTKTDALRIAGGTGITITTDPSTSEVKVTATGNATPGPHAETHLPGGTDVIPYATATTGGLMSPSDKSSITTQEETLNAHLSDNVKHITAAERSSWNAKETPEGAQAKATQAAEIAEGNAKAYAAPLIHTHDASDIVSGTIVAARLPSASTGAKGVVQLSDALNSTSTTMAATANAVKKAYDEVLVVKQSVVDGKGKVAGAINDMGGGPVSAANSFDELAAAIRANQGASGSTAITAGFFENFSTFRQSDTISGSWHFNKSGNAVGLMFQGSTGAYVALKVEVNPAGTRVSQVTLEPNFYATMSTNRWGYTKPDVYAYPAQYAAGVTGRMRIRNEAGTLMSDVEVPASARIGDFADVTKIGNVYMFSAYNYETNAWRPTVYNAALTKLFVSAVGVTNSDAINGGYFLDNKSFIYQCGGYLTKIYWDGGTWREEYTQVSGQSRYIGLLAAYAYR